MLKISLRVSMNHPVANTVVPSFDLKPFDFIFGNFLIADMWKEHRREIMLLAFLWIPENQKHTRKILIGVFTG